MPSLIRTVVVLVAVGALAAGAWADEEEENVCLECHGDPAEAGTHFVDGPLYARSVHGQQGLECTDCHGDHEEYPHPEDAESESCAGCHDDVLEDLRASVHARYFEGEEESPEVSRACIRCHGAHDVLPPEDEDSRLWALNVPRTCGQCHMDMAEKALTAPVERLLRERYTDDTHASGLLLSGLTSAPHCVACHGGHGVLHSTEEGSPVHKDRVSALCGRCHVGVYRQYKNSIHGRTGRGHADENRNHREPATCTDCHEPHGVKRPDEHFKVGIVRTCARCHEDRGNTYRGTYHGRITGLGFGGVASCDDCHTPHRIQRASDPASAMFLENGNRRRTCARCHEGATDEFARYAVHANPLSKEGWPNSVLYWGRTLMRGLIFSVWIVSGIHLLLWLQRELRERRRIREALRPVSGRWYRRWPPTYRALHMVLVCTFLTLALTGLPLRFYDRPWSQVIFTVLGGPETVRWLHRAAGVLTFGYFFAYLAHLARRIWKREKGLFRGPHTMIPRWKDLQDLAANLRWFVRGGKQPRFDRWTYWEKFDFWAEVWGVGFIGITGLVMWFPVESTYVLPAWAINLAHVLHSYEALLATTFIFSMHFFHANLRPAKFPLDPMFLTGRISEEELRHERPEEYERMLADGRLETEALPAPKPWLVRRAYWLGGSLLGLGLLLLLLMATTIF